MISQMQKKLLECLRVKLKEVQKDGEAKAIEIKQVEQRVHDLNAQLASQSQQINDREAALTTRFAEKSRLDRDNVEMEKRTLMS